MTIQASAMTSANLGTLCSLLAAALAVAVITFTGVAHLRPAPLPASDRGHSR
jgi:hypothetical protein